MTGGYIGGVEANEQFTPHPQLRNCDHTGLHLFVYLYARGGCRFCVSLYLLNQSLSDD